MELAWWLQNACSKFYLSLKTFLGFYSLLAFHTAPLLLHVMYTVVFTRNVATITHANIGTRVCSVSTKWVRAKPHFMLMHLSILCPTTPHRRHRWGLVGINRDLHVNFDLRGGAFDLNLCHEVRIAAKKVLVSWRSLENQKEAEWLTSLEEGKNYRQKYFQSFLMSSVGRK